MINGWKVKSLAAAALTLAALPAHAQTPLEIEYEEAQKLLNMALQEAAGSFDAMTVLPKASFENPFRAGVNVSAIVNPQNQLEIKGDTIIADDTQPESATHEFLTRPEGVFSPFQERTQTLAMGAVEAENPLHWALHGDRLYFTPAPVRDAEFREERGLSVRAGAEHLSQADAFRRNANFRATRPGS